MSGFEAATELRKLFPDLRTLIITQLRGPLEDECVRRRADGFIEKDEIHGRLTEEVRKLF
jgi:hypothetical protein